MKLYDSDSAQIVPALLKAFFFEYYLSNYLKIYLSSLNIATCNQNRLYNCLERAIEVNKVLISSYHGTNR